MKLSQELLDLLWDTLAREGKALDNCHIEIQRYGEVVWKSQLLKWEVRGGKLEADLGCTLVIIAEDPYVLLRDKEDRLLASIPVEPVTRAIQISLT